MLTPSLLTASAARALDEHGRFVLPQPATQYPIISEADARQRAEAWVRDYGTFNRPYLEKHHGGTIDFSTVRPCPRVYLAASAFPDLPAGLTAPDRNFLGPQWLVSLCAPDGTPQFSLAVAAYSTEVRVVDGHLVTPFHSGGEHFWEGIPPGAELPITPERAAAVAAELTGRKVAGVPELVLDGIRAPQYARWRVPLDASVLLRGTASGLTLRVSEVFVGSPDLDERVGLAIPDPKAPREFVHRQPVRDASLRQTGIRLIRIPVGTGQPHGFDLASVVPEER